jgi:hypothetical protein
MTTRIAAAVLLALLGWSGTARAQATAGSIEAARAQIENIRPDSAHNLLLRAPPPRGSTLEPRYWTLLGITELLLNRPADAQQSFRRALDADIALSVDSLSYLHSDVQRVFAAARSDLRRALGPPAPVTLVVAADTVVAPWQGRLMMEVRPRLRSRVIVAIAPERDPRYVLWADTQDVGAVATVAWDLQARGDIVPSGRYVLRVTAVDILRRAAPAVERTVIVSRAPVDTIAWETGGADPGATIEMPAPRVSPGRLLAGAALGIGAATLTSFVGNRSVNDGFRDRSRYVVAGAVTGAALVGFLTGRERAATAPPPEPVRESPNVRLLAEENARRRAAAPVRIQVGGNR